MMSLPELACPPPGLAPENKLTENKPVCFNNNCLLIRTLPPNTEVHEHVYSCAVYGFVKKSGS